MNNSSLTNVTDMESEKIVNMLSYVLYSLVVLLGVPGNVLVVWSLMSVRREQVNKSYKILVINLAVNDIIVVLLNAPFTITELYIGYFPFGSVMCVILWPLQTACVMAGVFNMVALNIHRYYVISYSGSARSLGKLTVVAVVLCWLVPILISAVPYAVHLKLETVDGLVSCAETLSDLSADVFTIYLFVVQYVLPLTVIATLNTLTIKRLKRRRLFRANSAKLSEESVHAHRRIVKMLVFIVLIFAIFGLPGQIMWLLPVVAGIEHDLSYSRILSLIDIFPFMYCVLNPLLFFTYNIECRERLKKFVSTVFFCCGYHWRKSHRLSSPTRLQTDAVTTLLPASRTSDSQDTSQSDGPRIDPRYAPAIPKYLLDKLQGNSQKDSNVDVKQSSVRHGLLSTLAVLYGSDTDFHSNATPSDSRQSMFHVLSSAKDKELFRGSFVELLRTGNVNNDLMRHLEASPETAIVEENIYEMSENDGELGTC